MGDVATIRNQILEERRKHYHLLQEVEVERDNVHEAKTTISELIKQISNYKTALEEEKADLEADLVEKDEELEKEASIASSLKTSIQSLEDEKKTLMEQITALEQQHEEALEEENKRKSQMKQETLENLQTLMEELQRIEEANELLRDQQEKSKQQIQEEQKLHDSTLEELIREKEKAEEQKATMETLKLTNEALLAQLKQFRQASSLVQATQQLRRDSAKRLSGTFAKLNGSNSQGYQLIRTLRPPHRSGVSAALLVGGQLWVGTSDGSLRIWEVETGQMLEERKHHTGKVTCLLLAKDKVWSSSQDRSILVWSPKPTKKFAAGNKEKDVFGNVLIEVDQFVWCGCSDGVVRLWDTKHPGKCKKELKDNSSSVTCMLKRSNQLWTGTESGNIFIWNTTVLSICAQLIHQTLRPMKTLAGHSGTIHSFTNVGPFEIWSCSEDKTIRCWNADVNETFVNSNSQGHTCIKTLKTPTNVLSLLQVRSLHHVWGGTEESKIYVWNAKTYELIQEISSPHKDYITTLTLDKKNQIWSGSADCSISIWR